MRSWHSIKGVSFKKIDHKPVSSFGFQFSFEGIGNRTTGNTGKSKGNREAIDISLILPRVPRGSISNPRLIVIAGQPGWPILRTE
jgi:hypothetical protein